jgi:hypothetical protein
MERLDEQKLELLRRWGEGLTNDEREEVRAAGRAILILSDEIHRLRADLASSADQDGPAVDVDPDAEALEWQYGPSAAEVSSTLRDRITAFASRAKK